MDNSPSIITHKVLADIENIDIPITLLVDIFAMQYSNLKKYTVVNVVYDTLIRVLCKLIKDDPTFPTKEFLTRVGLDDKVMNRLIDRINGHLGY